MAFKKHVIGAPGAGFTVKQMVASGHEDTPGADIARLEAGAQDIFLRELERF
jgi:hypothetical protein